MDDLPWDDTWPHAISSEDLPDADPEAHLGKMPTEEELAQHDEDTDRHIENVARKMLSLKSWMDWPVKQSDDPAEPLRRMTGWIETLLEERLRNHDNSKKEWPERPIFARINARLSGLSYGSEEYKDALDFLDPALQHHYAANPHHPEFYEEGIFGMTLLDLGEMTCDWAAAIERHDDGHPLQSMDQNRGRFDIPDGLAILLTNTLFWLQGHDYSPQGLRDVTILGLFWEFIRGQDRDNFHVRRSPIGHGDPAVEQILSNTRLAFSEADHNLFQD